MDTNHSPIISPLTMRESARGITLTSIYDEMLARRELSVMGNIETPMATTYASRSACSMPPTPAAPSPYLSPAPAEACDRVSRSMTSCASHRAPSAPSAWNSPRPWAP